MTSWLLPQWLQDWCRKLADGLVPLLAFFGKVFNPLIAVVLGVYEFVSWLWTQFTGIRDRTGGFHDAYMSFKGYVGDAAFSPFPHGAQQAIAFLNGFFPVTETLILMGMLAALYVLAVIVRIVKSFAPTIAS